MKVAFVHDWLDTYRGGEKVLETMLEMFPHAPIYTMFYKPDALPNSITKRDVRFPKRWQYLQRWRKLLLPWLPRIVESFDLNEFDLIISSSSAVAKGIIPPPWAKHLCYLHSPMRYIWDQRFDYRDTLSKIPGAGWYFDGVAEKMRVWDSASAHRVDKFLVNSTFVKRRVGLYYGRTSDVLHPPISCADFERLRLSFGIPTRDYFVVAGAMVPYKRIDLAIRACENSGVRLVVAGQGPMQKKLQAMASKHTKFVIGPSSVELAKLIFNAKALLFPGIEDFGLVPIEAMALGTPVIAYARGGALDYIKHGEQGLLFEEQTVEALSQGLSDFQRMTFDPEYLAQSVKRFDKARFLEQLKTQINAIMT